MLGFRPELYFCHFVCPGILHIITVLMDEVASMKLVNFLYFCHFVLLWVCYFNEISDCFFKKCIQIEDK